VHPYVVRASGLTVGLVLFLVFDAAVEAFRTICEAAGNGLRCDPLRTRERSICGCRGVCWKEIKIAIGRRSRCSLGHNRDVLLVVMGKHSTISEVYAIAARHRNLYTYTFDTSSNRTQVRKNGVPFQSLSFGQADVITSFGYVYDDAGHLISDTTTSGLRRHFTWDGYGRLLSVDIYDPATGHTKNIRYAYDPQGRLSARDSYLDHTYKESSSRYHYDGTRLIAEEDMTGIVREYLYGGGEAPTAMRSRNSDGSYSNYFFITNTHGDVVTVTDKDGQVVNRYAYGFWGEATRISEQLPQPFRYAGYYYDQDAELYWLRARWYDPGTGRFLSRDPIAVSSTAFVRMNSYAYAANSPPTLVDSSGLSPVSRNVIALFHGQSASAPFEIFRTFVREEFPGWHWAELTYHLSSTGFLGGPPEQELRLAALTLRQLTGRGFTLFAIAHSEGGDMVFRAAERSGAFIEAVATLGSPIKQIRGSQRRHIGFWARICLSGDIACSAFGLEGPTANNADLNLYPSGCCHHLADYLNHPYVRRSIVEVFRSRGL
jgi:RHS repeat-associated protein